MFALSADAFVEDERLSAESGMNGHFAKPVDFAALQRSIGKFLRQRTKVYRKHRKSNRFLQRQKQFCVCGICVIFVVLSYTVKWEC